MVMKMHWDEALGIDILSSSLITSPQHPSLPHHGTQDPTDSPRHLNTALKFSQPPTSTSPQHDVEDPATANPPPRRRNTARKICHRPCHPDTARKTPPTCHATSTRRSRPRHRQPTSMPPSHGTQDPRRMKGPP
ncbi:hypothetical protein EDB83DRAFT_2523387 [Lactarius deliciosus]|nr:hypothetical protein EDB83DRAFT_2523387 [Lactarius deliciosus]